ncbi:MAG TPA: hypothetical protein VN493_01635 [Thermoanaerobaculia bacterium]|nr:hypothetical protein [Thermoanaerobaculia bacterium]
MILEARPISIFTRKFSIEAEGQKIALLDSSIWRVAGAISIGRQNYQLYREGLMSGAFLLENEGQVVARAIKPSAFSSQFDLEFRGRRYSLTRASVFGRGFAVFQGEVVVGSIHPAGMFIRRTIIDLPPDWSIPFQVFVFWLVLVVWKRASAATATGLTGT